MQARTRGLKSTSLDTKKKRRSCKRRTKKSNTRHGKRNSLAQRRSRKGNLIDTISPKTSHVSEKDTKRIKVNLSAQINERNLE